MVLNQQKRVRVQLPLLERFARRVQRELRLNGWEMAICLVSDATIARLNKKYRGKNEPTDVLSFPAVERSAQKFDGAFLGDIAIAPAVAKRNAKRFERSFADELRILILHGVLHLMGYDHETDNGQMARRERLLRRRLALE